MQKNNIISKVRLPLTAILLLFSLTTCSKEEAPTDFVTTDTPDEGNDNMTVMKEKMRITIADTTFIATLEDNATTRALVEMLPLTLQMNELNGNEKYHYLPTSLPPVLALFMQATFYSMVPHVSWSSTRHSARVTVIQE